MTNPALLVVALDIPRAEQALDLAGRLRGVVPWVKVGLELYLDAGHSLVGRLKDLGFAVFLDLKFMDIPNTVAGAVAQATRMGADMLTVHTLGGGAMCEAALAARERATATGQTPPLILGVTILTSLSAGDLPWIRSGQTENLPDLTVHLAGLARRWKLDGVVCSGREVRVIRETCGPSFHVLTPGIRLPEADTGDQARVCTPAQAARDGSNFLVVGRPITRADDPVRAAQRYVEAIESFG